uniref:Uncharacterized protein n=1 Tax=Anguilla anguilla TaxID=7936 RepID=A0A0E9PBT9_ANGAN
MASRQRTLSSCCCIPGQLAHPLQYPLELLTCLLQDLFSLHRRAQHSQRVQCHAVITGSWSRAISNTFCKKAG